MVMVSDFFTKGHGFDSSKVPFYVSMFRARQKLSTKKSIWPTGEFKTKDLWSCSFSEVTQVIGLALAQEVTMAIGLASGGCLKNLKY